MDTTSEIRSSASWTIVRNLRIGKGTPLRPARGWMKSTGPRESSLIITATAISSGVSTTRPIVATTTSSVRLSAIVDREGSRCGTRSPGSSAMWLSSTAVPSIARIGGATLSFTPSERQLRTTRASVGSSSSGAARITRSARWPRSAPPDRPGQLLQRDLPRPVTVGRAVHLGGINQRQVVTGL